MNKISNISLTQTTKNNLMSWNKIKRIKRTVTLNLTTNLLRIKAKNREAKRIKKGND